MEPFREQRSQAEQMRAPGDSQDPLLVSKTVPAGCLFRSSEKTSAGARGRDSRVLAGSSRSCMSRKQAQQTSAGRGATEVDAIYQRIDHSGQHPSIPPEQHTHCKIKVAQPEPGKLHAAGKLDSDSRLRPDLRNGPPPSLRLALSRFSSHAPDDLLPHHHGVKWSTIKSQVGCLFTEGHLKKHELPRHSAASP